MFFFAGVCVGVAVWGNKQSEPDQRPTAEDTLLWLEDLTDLLPDDQEPTRETIDYDMVLKKHMDESEFFFFVCDFYFCVTSVAPVV